MSINEQKLIRQFSRMFALMHLNNKENGSSESSLHEMHTDDILVSKLLRADPSLTDEEHAYLLEMYTSFIGNEPIEVEYLDIQNDSLPSNEDYRLGAKLISGSGKTSGYYI